MAIRYLDQEWEYKEPISTLPSPINQGIASVATPTTATSTDPWAQILAQISQMQASPVDLRASMTSNPNEVNPGPGSGGTNLAWGNVPGLERFYSYDAQNNQEHFDLASALPEIERLGYKVMQGFNPGAETSGTWVVGPDGKPIAQSAYLTGTNDDNFRIASQLASALVGNAVGGWAAAGNNPMSSGIGATATAPPVDVGGLSGWDAAMADAAKSGAITPEWMSGAVNPWDLSMDNPNWQPNPADYTSPSQVGGIGDSVTITAPSMPTAPVNVGGAIGAGIGATLPSTQLPYEQTVEVEGKRLPNENDPTYYPGDPFVDSVESRPPSGTQPTTQNPVNDGDAPTGQNDPHNDNLDPGGTGPSTIPPATDWSSAIKDWVLKNPKLAMTLAGSLLGKAGGSNTPAPPAPGTGPQAGFTATPAPGLGRQYVAPPPGYRPGFDPEHRYFTGIGAVGTGG